MWNIGQIYESVQIYGLEWGMPWYDSKWEAIPVSDPDVRIQFVPASMSNLEIIVQLIMTSPCNIIETRQSLSIWID